MKLDRLDHLVLTVRDIEATCAFYERVLGMSRQSFAKGRVALHFGDQKINLHPHPSPIDPKAAVPEPGSADLCFITDTPIDEICSHLRAQGIEIEVGPKTTEGALGPMTSIYLRDPDGNLIEIANYPDG
jgi:catechol 2,3-dioxygenase-like lactoylglutathione lyase family enzyme